MAKCDEGIDVFVVDFFLYISQLTGFGQWVGIGSDPFIGIDAADDFCEDAVVGGIKFWR